eukprot:10734281-Ditylum_brightwellii.AAC.1
MGQKHGRATFQPSVKPFLNLSRPAMEALWTAFHYITDGFALTLHDVQEICVELIHHQFDCSGDYDDINSTDNRKAIYEQSKSLFDTFDTDSNGLIDSFEFFASLAISSSMTNKEKLNFLFRCFDFNNLQALTIDEVTLAMRSAIYGLLKMEIIADEKCSYADDNCNNGSHVYLLQKNCGKEKESPLSSSSTTRG